MILSWFPPSNDGGSPVTGYHLERRSPTSKRWVFVNKIQVRDTKIKVTELIEDTEYEFRVTAENKIGMGTPSEPSKPILARDPWDKPGKPGHPEIVEVMKKAATIKWTEPRDDGGSPITGYVIEYKIEGGFKWQSGNDEKVTNLTYTIRGLKDGYLYDFRVAATNKAGKGEYAETTQSVQVKEPIIGDPPQIKTQVADITVISPEVATLECGFKPGTSDYEIRW